MKNQWYFFPLQQAEIERISATCGNFHCAVQFYTTIPKHSVHKCYSIKQTSVKASMLWKLLISSLNLQWNSLSRSILSAAQCHIMGSQEPRTHLTTSSTKHCATYSTRLQRFSTTDFQTGYYLYLCKSAGGSSASLEIAQIASASLDDLLKVSQPQYSKQLLLHFSAPSLSP